MHAQPCRKQYKASAEDQTEMRAHRFGQQRDEHHQHGRGQPCQHRPGQVRRGLGDQICLTLDGQRADEVHLSAVVEVFRDDHGAEHAAERRKDRDERIGNGKKFLQIRQCAFGIFFKSVGTVGEHQQVHDRQCEEQDDRKQQSHRPGAAHLVFVKPRDKPVVVLAKQTGAYFG